MRTLLAVVIAMVCMSDSCERNDGQNRQKDCTDAICTDIFQMVTVTVSDANMPQAALETYTLRVRTGEKIKPEGSMQNGMYVVLDDNYRKQLANKEEEFHFIALKNGTEVVNESYIIRADCCHIEKVSGKSEITIP